MASPQSFKDLPPPSESIVLAELHGQFIAQVDQLPRKFEEKDYAPFITLRSFPPLYSTRTQHRASRPRPEIKKTPTWAFIYYVDLPRLKLAEVYCSLQRLRDTPGDLLAGYCYSLAQRYMNEREEPEQNLIRKDTDEEKINHIAFHPVVLLLAMATSYDRVHLFDLRTNSFLDYYLVADDPSERGITSLAFNTANQIAVGLESGCVHVWTVDISAPRPKEWELSSTPRKALGPLFSVILETPQEHKPAFFETRPSPGGQRLLPKPQKATLERVELVADGFASQDQLVGAVTALAFSPSGKHLAVGTSHGGVWIYNLVQETSFRAYVGTAKCTCLTWGVPPGVERLHLNRGHRYQNETGCTALVAGMDSGLVVYLTLWENGASGFLLGSDVVEFYPGKATGNDDKGIGQVLLVPSLGVLGAGSGEKSYASFQTIVISFVGLSGIFVFRIIPESVLKASVPSAPVAEASLTRYIAAAAKRVYESAVAAVGRLIGYETQDTMKTVHVGTLDTSHVLFPGESGGYGGVVESMAIDPTAQRLVVSFSDRVARDSVVWFDVSAITTAPLVLRALRVLRCGARMGEVAFAGTFEDGACAGMVMGDGAGVGVFPAWIGKGNA